MGFNGTVRGVAVLLGWGLFCQPVLAQDATPGSQWLTYNNRLDGQRYSPLKQINTTNVAQLGEV
jgi:hypothetical protein